MENSKLINPMPNSYSGTGWKGKMYDINLTTKDIAERIRHFCKKRYPECAFSIRKRDHNSIGLALMKAPYSVFETPDIEKIPSGRFHSKEDDVKYWNQTIEKGHHGVNQYYINDDHMLNAKGKEIMNFLKDCTLVYNFDDSDAQTDYFHTNFYIDLSIGKWDKPFIKTN